MTFRLVLSRRHVKNEGVELMILYSAEKRHKYGVDDVINNSVKLCDKYCR